MAFNLERAQTSPAAKIDAEELPATPGGVVSVEHFRAVKEFTECREKTGLTIRSVKTPEEATIISLVGEDGAVLTKGEFTHEQAEDADAFYEIVCNALRDFADSAENPRDALAMRKFLGSYQPLLTYRAS